jgi:tryptophanyl-tRNA synthetase
MQSKRRVAKDVNRDLCARARLGASGSTARLGSATFARVKTSLTGIKPTHGPHLGNYLGAIRPALALASEYKTLYFIADYHALTSVREAEALRHHTRDVAACWLASGLDPARTILFKQSSVPEVFELAWVLSCLLATGQLERGHAYKDALGRGDSPNAGIFNYPVLMAADILLYDTDVVPVGQDQKQHLELCRDVAARLNHLYGEGTVVVPEAVISEAPLVPGTDGLKMSKSRGNAIPLFAPAKDLKKAIMGITTGSEPLEAPKEPEGTVFRLFEQVAPDKAPAMAEKLRAGGYGWGHAKLELFEAIEAELGPKRERFHALREDTALLDTILEEGAEKARVIARATLARVRSAVGVAPARG